jgi:uncharacterized protein
VTPPPTADPTMSDLQPLRLPPGADLRATLEQAARGLGMAAFVVCGIGSLADARPHLAGASVATVVGGPCEFVSLAGSLTPDGAHLHIAVADAQGRVHGGHLVPGNVVRTAAELLLAWLAGSPLGREFHPQTGHAELVLPRARRGG